MSEGEWTVLPSPPRPERKRERREVSAWKEEGRGKGEGGGGTGWVGRGRTSVAVNLFDVRGRSSVLDGDVGDRMDVASSSLRVGRDEIIRAARDIEEKGNGTNLSSRSDSLASLVMALPDGGVVLVELPEGLRVSIRSGPLVASSASAWPEKKKRSERAKKRAKARRA